jgi:hypothetical protein
MPSAFENFFDNNLIKICMDNNFKDLNCILGTTEIIISLILILITFLGLIKLLNYYDKINFETALLLFSIIQIVLLDIIIIIPHDFLFECFFFVQICHISLTIRKFVILTKQEKNSIKENILFILLNIINIIIFTFYILSLLDIFLNNIYLYIQSTIRIYYFITAIFLAFFCHKAIIKLKKFENRHESYELKLKHQDSAVSNNSNLVVSFQNNDWMFFLIRERQIKPLYILNLICSFIQMVFILSKHFLLENFFQKDEYKLISLKDEGYIIYYFYLIFCFLNVFVNYFCFYWIVREQFDYNTNEINKTNKNRNKNILNEEFIERETINNKQDEKEIQTLMEDKKDKKKFAKSIYSNTFTEANDEDNQEKYFVQDNEEEKEKEKEKEENKLEMVQPSYEDISGRGTMVSNNPINQSTNNDNFLENLEKI